MNWLLLLKSKAARLIIGIAAGVAFILTAIGVIRRDARKDHRREMQEQDHENADSIRRDVERDLDERVRDYEDRGFRD